eukprot:scaffold33490_cov47-Phaeocystis_antarctica.AAC.1
MCGVLRTLSLKLYYPLLKRILRVVTSDFTEQATTNKGSSPFFIEPRLHRYSASAGAAARNRAAPRPACVSCAAAPPPRHSPGSMSAVYHPYFRAIYTPNTPMTAPSGMRP